MSNPQGTSTAGPVKSGSASGELDSIAAVVRSLSREQWGDKFVVDLIGASEPLGTSLRRLRRFAPLDNPILLIGETGTGKELFARSAYLLSPRRGRPFISINCARYADSSLITSELFGHKKGSFTGATTDHRGLMKEADGGVLFLDEIGDLVPPAQAMLLRTLSEGQFLPIGSTRPIQTDVRIVAATNRDLRQLTLEGAFREDLCFRLSLRVRIPPLRHRDRDWMLIAQYVLDKLNAEHGTAKQLSKRAIDLMDAHDWPGNVRELQNVIYTGYSLAAGPSLEPDHIRPEFQSSTARSLITPRLCSCSEQTAQKILRAIADDYGTFWELVRAPYLRRDLNRLQVRKIIDCGLRRSGGSYKRMLPLLGLEDADYQQFMDFLRNHRLKPH